jgi:hypothetical protein
MAPDATLLPLREVTDRLQIKAVHYAGLREIPVRDIVGSVDRSVDFDQYFRPRRRDLRKRLDTLRDAFGDRPMPPINVYEAGGLYFVSDGHHRVALARRDGAEVIDAEVTEMETSHRLHPGVDVLELVHTHEHRIFKERTGLADAAPGAVIEFSRPVGYRQLTEIIEAVAYRLSETRGELVPVRNATRSWYNESWLPALAAIESTGLRRIYDFKTDGDRYLWTHQKLEEMRAIACDATWEDAAAANARIPVARTHRRDTLAIRRKPLPVSTPPKPEVH